MGVVLQCRAVLKAPLQDRTTVAWPDLSLCERVARTWYALAHGAAPQAAGSMATTLLALADDEDALEVSDSEVCLVLLVDQWFMMCDAHLTMQTRACFYCCLYTCPSACISIAL